MRTIDYSCLGIDTYSHVCASQYPHLSRANAHPGGATILRKFNGKDATNAFKRIGHSQHAVDLLDKFAKEEKGSSGTVSKKHQTKPTAAPGSWKKRLFTREDPQNIHKCCGLFVLLHFAYRFYQMLFSDISAGFGTRTGQGPSFACMLCLIPHAVLSLSSLIFHTVPKERIVGSPMIWQEFRAHSIIFALRSIVNTVLVWTSVYFDHAYPVRKITLVLSSATILLAIYAADEATKRLSVCNSESTTATMPYWEGCSMATQRRFKSFYALCQFLATMACMSHSNPCWPFSVMLPIQLAALLMTLVRKSFISAWTYHIVYTLSLVLP